MTTSELEMLRQMELLQRDIVDVMEQRDRYRNRVVELAAVLAKIQAWEMLNPPRVDLLPDLGWLKAVVMKANLTGGAGAQPNES